MGGSGNFVTWLNHFKDSLEQIAFGGGGEKRGLWSLETFVNVWKFDCFGYCRGLLADLVDSCVNVVDWVVNGADMGKFERERGCSRQYIDYWGERNQVFRAFRRNLALTVCFACLVSLTVRYDDSPDWICDLTEKRKRGEIGLNWINGFPFGACCTGEPLTESEIIRMSKELRIDKTVNHCAKLFREVVPNIVDPLIFFRHYQMPDFELTGFGPYLDFPIDGFFRMIDECAHISTVGILHQKTLQIKADMAYMNCYHSMLGSSYLRKLSDGVLLIFNNEENSFCSLKRILGVIENIRPAIKISFGPSSLRDHYCGNSREVLEFCSSAQVEDEHLLPFLSLTIQEDIDPSEWNIISFVPSCLKELILQGENFQGDFVPEFIEALKETKPDLKRLVVKPSRLMMDVSLGFDLLEHCLLTCSAMTCFEVGWIEYVWFDSAFMERSAKLKSIVDFLKGFSATLTRFDFPFPDHHAMFKVSELLSKYIITNRNMPPYRPYLTLMGIKNRPEEKDDDSELFSEPYVESIFQIMLACTRRRALDSQSMSSAAGALSEKFFGTLQQLRIYPQKVYLSFEPSSGQNIDELLYSMTLYPCFMEETAPWKEDG
eukprot:CAMPEP_0115020684 /NCGR_PEP_ID=MMETSP0216-20121206/30334_1 /TAXON_ID=223996 /ORGANISM="Protocruzia adherens, Strain Boccale" /LENGTH=601 /DNA_ID=CAMNT_0002392689 /DNA_START=926 /DNA_END=2730 /DNA_ORIENTATION=-